MSDNRWFHGNWEAGDDISPLQTELATELRIPFLTSPHPSRSYVTGIVVETELWRGEIPTDEEVAEVAAVRNSYIDYFFPQPNVFRREMEAFAPYDIDSGAVAFYFIKRSDGGWAYRRRTWKIGPFWSPAINEPPMTLSELIERRSLLWERSARI